MQAVRLQRRVEAGEHRARRMLRAAGVLLVLALFVLSACTARWQAPVENRGATRRAAPSIAPTATHYRVQRGDTLFGIAWQAGKDVQALARWNGIAPPYTIYPGQKLRLVAPSGVKRAATPKPAARSVASPSTRTAAKARTAPDTRKPVSAQTRLRWLWPVEGPLRQGFRSGDPLRKGIQIKGRYGAEIRAAETGRVVYSGSGLVGYGRLIIIKHNKEYLSAYGHNSKVLVREGDQVTRGSKIAEMGRADDGVPVLHFEIRRKGSPVDPVALLPRGRR